jgi:hypothetical protein
MLNIRASAIRTPLALISGYGSFAPACSTVFNISALNDYDPNSGWS